MGDSGLEKNMVNFITKMTVSPFLILVDEYLKSKCSYITFAFQTTTKATNLGY